MTEPASVDAYMAALPEPSRAVLEGLRATIRAAAPGATELISYGMPAFKVHGRLLVYYAAFKNHVSLFPASGSAIEAHREELAPYVTSKGTIRFSLDAPLPADLIARIVKARVAENAARNRG